MQSDKTITQAKHIHQKVQAFHIQKPHSSSKKVLALLQRDNHTSNRFQRHDLAMLWVKTLPHPSSSPEKGGGAAYFAISLHHTRKTHVTMEVNLIPSHLTLLRSGCTTSREKNSKRSRGWKSWAVSILPFFVPSLLGSQNGFFKASFPLLSQCYKTHIL